MAHLPVEFPESVRTRLPADLMVKLSQAVASARDWVMPLPQQSLFYFNEIVNIRRRCDLARGIRHRDVMFADVFFDVHSMLSTLCLVKSWRLEQLTDGLVFSLGSWNLSVGASMARCLVELASSWAIEAREAANLWRELKQRKIENEDEAMSVRSELKKGTLQMGIGTRLPSILKSGSGPERKNVLTFVDRAESVLERPGLRADYDVLCDAVHPSWGSNECFWRESGRGKELSAQLRVLVSKEAIGWVDACDRDAIRPGSPLAYVVLKASEWALRTLVTELRSFDRLCRDLCLTARIHRLADLTYWGVVAPKAPYEACSCGSGEKTTFCPHTFGDRPGSGC